jgi:hypothetical protein
MPIRVGYGYQFTFKTNAMGYAPLHPSYDHVQTAWKKCRMGGAERNPSRTITSKQLGKNVGWVERSVTHRAPSRSR